MKFPGRTLFFGTVSYCISSIIFSHWFSAKHLPSPRNWSPKLNSSACEGFASGVGHSFILTMELSKIPIFGDSPCQRNIGWKTHIPNLQQSFAKPQIPENNTNIIKHLSIITSLVYVKTSGTPSFIQKSPRQLPLPGASAKYLVLWSQILFPECQQSWIMIGLNCWHLLARLSEVCLIDL